MGWGPRTPPHKLGLVRHASWLQISPRLRLGELWGPPRNSGFASSLPEATRKAGVVPRRHPAPEVPSASAATVPPTSAPPQRSRPSPSLPCRALLVPAYHPHPDEPLGRPPAPSAVLVRMRLAPAHHAGTAHKTARLPAPRPSPRP